MELSSTEASNASPSSPISLRDPYSFRPVLASPQLICPPPITPIPIAFYCLLQEILSSACISILPSEIKPVPQTPTQSANYQSTYLLLQDARTASIEELVDIVLNLLLSKPPWKHMDQVLLKKQQEKFLGIWGRDEGGYSPADAGQNGINSEALGPSKGLELLYGFRMNLQDLGSEGFVFVSQLLLSCLHRLSPEGSSRSVNAKSWVKEHGNAVAVITELLFAAPVTDWGKLDEHAGYLEPTWKCLGILCRGAGWWGRSAEFRDALERLARCFFKLPIASSLLTASLRVGLQPSEIHSTVDILLGILEANHGIPVDEKINAFTPRPFNFPLPAALDRHDFSKTYEFANLRVLFVAWVNATDADREREEYVNVWNMEMVLQHSETWRGVKMHPESAVRVGLVCLFNEFQRRTEGFKPSTDSKIMELIEGYVTHCYEKRKSGFRPEACVLENAAWILPWIWKRRMAGLEFVLAVTSNWFLASCEKVDGVLDLIRGNNEVAFEVIHDFFTHVFRYEFIAVSAEPKNTLKQVGRLLKVVLEVLAAIVEERRELGNGQLCLLVVRCCAEGIDREWIPGVCWAMVLQLLTKIPRGVLENAVRLAGVGNEMEMFIPVFLREMEIITAQCENSTAATLRSGQLKKQLAGLTAMLQFCSFIARVNERICASFAKKSHFITSTLTYLSRNHNRLFINSPSPELVWSYAASVGAACELLIVLFTLPLQPGSMGEIKGTDKGKAKAKGLGEEVTNNEIIKLVEILIGGRFEMSYVISPLCGLVQILDRSYWIGRPFIYLDVFATIRNVLLNNECHTWCILLDVFIPAIEALLEVEAPIAQTALNNRWNLTLTSRLFLHLLSSPVCPICSTRIDTPILYFLHLILSRNPTWKLDLLKESSKTPYAILTLAQLDALYETYTEKQEKNNVKSVIGIIESFPQWSANAAAKRRRFERGLLVEHVWRGGGERDAWGVYGVCRPVEGVGGCLVPRLEWGGREVGRERKRG
ncbi:hypothetical protein RUND412_003645 [Rhizina undulata]